MKKVVNMSRLVNQLEKMFRALNADFFGGDISNKPTAKTHNYKWVCPCCGAIARSGKPIKLICGDCLQTMVEG